jgi:septal ring factor EnvC (AmiA/AmiB activator)
VLASVAIGLGETFALAQTAAGTTPLTAEEAAKKLETQKSDLASKQERATELKRDVASIAEERRELSARLRDTAALVQQSEAQMTAIEARLASLEKQETDARTALAREHGKIAILLSALQRMGRNPPPVMITRREDALKMVRSAMLIATAFPEMRGEAMALAKKLSELVAIKDGIRAEADKLRAETERLNTNRTRLSALLETKKQSMAEREAELGQVREAAAEISKNVVNLSELISKLSAQVAAPPAMVAYEKEAQQAAPAAPPASDQPAAVAQAKPPEPAEPSAPAGKAEKVALLTPPAAETPSSSIVELAPAATSLVPGSPDRIKPAIAFSQARGKLPLPAQGRRVLGFGDKTQYGGTSKGLVLETRYGARVTSPCDGWVVYAGEFRSYGQLLIINAGGGYHVLVAGLSQMDVEPGQFVLAAEPIGTMSGAPRTALLASDKTGQGQSASPGGAPVLYIEFRKDGQPVDSDPWWVASHQKVLE